jgi:hypothetical protein
MGEKSSLAHRAGRSLGHRLVCYTTPFPDRMKVQRNIGCRGPGGRLTQVAGTCSRWLRPTMVETMIQPRRTAWKCTQLKDSIADLFAPAKLKCTGWLCGCHEGGNHGWARLLWAFATGVFLGRFPWAFPMGVCHARATAARGLPALQRAAAGGVRQMVSIASRRA